METLGNIKGVHLEGPYLNPYFGAEPTGEGQPIKREEYMEIAAEGVVKQWTFSPEVKGTLQFAEDIVEAGIVPAIGHSCAAPSEVYAAAEAGTKIVTHLFDATGSSISPTQYDGTIEVSFDAAALLCDDLYYEIICDSKGVHVRGDMVKLAAKTVGVDRIMGVTDACTGDDSDTDINIVNGELYGSKLTMDKVAKNFKALGFTVPEVFRITAATPAKVCRLDSVGTLEAGKDADILILNDELDVLKIYTSF
jgi:N-acetylglucosamine-6-phosphate deacetylase